jgi:hypothetical protein
MKYINTIILFCILITLIAIRFSISELAENRNWPQRVTEINHNQYDVGVTSGGVVMIPDDEFGYPDFAMRKKK